MWGSPELLAEHVKRGYVVSLDVSIVLFADGAMLISQSELADALSHLAELIATADPGDQSFGGLAEDGLLRSRHGAAIGVIAAVARPAPGS